MKRNRPINHTKRIKLYTRILNMQQTTEEKDQKQKTKTRYKRELKKKEKKGKKN